VDNDRPGENNEKGYVTQEYAPAWAITVEVIEEDSAFFG